jgi:hypothetical protein
MLNLARVGMPSPRPPSASVSLRENMQAFFEDPGLALNCRWLHRKPTLDKRLYCGGARTARPTARITKRAAAHGRSSPDTNMPNAMPHEVGRPRVDVRFCIAATTAKSHVLGSARF